MSDKIDIKISKEYLHMTLNDFMNLVNEIVNKKYPGYKLAWMSNMSKNMIKEELKEEGIKNAKVVELDTNVLTLNHYCVLIPEGKRYYL